jgi:hypothetical protein
MAALAPRCRRLCKHRLVRRFGAAGWGVAVFGTVASSAEAFGCVLRSANVLLRFCDANCSRQDKTSQGKESPAQANGGYVWEHPAARGRRSSRRRGRPQEEQQGASAGGACYEHRVPIGTPTSTALFDEKVALTRNGTAGVVIGVVIGSTVCSPRHKEHGIDRVRSSERAPWARLSERSAMPGHACPA